MPNHARLAHINLVARDWKRLAAFYQEVLCCEPIPPERNLSGKWLREATGIENAAIQGIHLRLPGYGPAGPTLEIFQYNRSKDRLTTALNRPGFAHIAFSVDSVKDALAEVIRAGGQSAGKLVSATVPAAGRIKFVYATDPEGNIIELQKWES
ncbi:VOC family protein [Thermodesulfobacteriota bacterium]